MLQETDKNDVHRPCINLDLFLTTQSNFSWENTSLVPEDFNLQMIQERMTNNDFCVG